MSLPTIDMNKIRIAQEKDWLRQLESYLRGRFPRMLARPQYDSRQLTQALELAWQRGKDDDMSAGILKNFVITSVLLGREWDNDPQFGIVIRIAKSATEREENRAHSMLSLAIDAKKHHERVHEALKAEILALLGARENVSNAQFRHDWLRWIGLRFSPPVDRWQKLWLVYERDFRELQGLPARQDKFLKTTIDEAWQGYSSEQANRLTLHVLLALTFGRYFYRNPLTQPLAEAYQATQTNPRKTELLAILSEKRSTDGH